MFVDLDWPLNASSLLSASAELLVYFLFLYFYYIINIYYLFHYFLFTIIFFILLGMDSKCFLTSTDQQTRRARCQHQLSFLFYLVSQFEHFIRNSLFSIGELFCVVLFCKLIPVQYLCWNCHLSGRFRAAVPSGASTGIHEALELRDKGKDYHGKGIFCIQCGVCLYAEICICCSTYHTFIKYYSY